MYDPDRPDAPRTTFRRGDELLVILSVATEEVQCFYEDPHRRLLGQQRRQGPHVPDRPTGEPGSTTTQGNDAEDVPTILDFDVTPALMQDNGLIKISVSTMNADGVRMQLETGDAIELDLERPGFLDHRPSRRRRRGRPGTGQSSRSPGALDHPLVQIQPGTAMRRAVVSCQRNVRALGNRPIVGTTHHRRRLDPRHRRGLDGVVEVEAAAGPVVQRDAWPQRGEGEQGVGNEVVHEPPAVVAQPSREPRAATARRVRRSKSRAARGSGPRQCARTACDALAGVRR